MQRTANEARRGRPPSPSLYLSLSLSLSPSLFKWLMHVTPRERATPKFLYCKTIFAFSKIFMHKLLIFIYNGNDSSSLSLLEIGPQPASFPPSLSPSLPLLTQLLALLSQGWFQGGRASAVQSGLTNGYIY